MKELKRFEKIELQPGEAKTVSFEITPEMLEFSGLEMKKVLEPGKMLVMVGGSSDKTLNPSFKIIN